MRKTVFTLGLCLFSILLFSQDSLVLKKRIAVVDFEDKSGTVAFRASDQSGSTTSYNRRASGPSRSLTDMLTTALSRTQAYQIVEREQLDKLLGEQNLGKDGTVTAQSAAQAGKVLGAQFIVTGSITEYGQKREVKSQNYVYWKTSSVRNDARVVIDIRLVNTTTGEVMVSESAVGEAENTSRSNTLQHGSTADNTLLGQATRKAMDNCVEIIGKATAKAMWEGRVLKVTAEGVIVKPGSAGGVRPGMTFTVYSKGQAVIDPETGLSLGTDAKKTAQIRVTEDIGTEGLACRAVVVSGTGIKEGDLVRVR
jgi:curli biogenesis system outer membrane secretion channel CsgG